MPLESKRIAALLLHAARRSHLASCHRDRQHSAKERPATARGARLLIRKRLMTLDVQGWEMITVRESGGATSAFAHGCH